MQPPPIPTSGNVGRLVKTRIATNTPVMANARGRENNWRKELHRQVRCRRSIA